MMINRILHIQQALSDGFLGLTVQHKSAAYAADGLDHCIRRHHKGLTDGKICDENDYKGQLDEEACEDLAVVGDDIFEGVPHFNLKILLHV